MQNKWRDNVILITAFVVTVMMLILLYMTGQVILGNDAGDYLYRSYSWFKTLKQGNWWLQYDEMWQNGMEPLGMGGWMPIFILTIGQLLDGGDVWAAYMAYLGVVFLAGFCSWHGIGLRMQKKFIGPVIGIIWFFLPWNLYLIFSQGNLSAGLALGIVPGLIGKGIAFAKEKRKADFYWIITGMISLGLCNFSYGLAGAILFLIIFLILKRKMNLNIAAIGLPLTTLLLALFLTAAPAYWCRMECFQGEKQEPWQKSDGCSEKSQEESANELFQKASEITIQRMAILDGKTSSSMLAFKAVYEYEIPQCMAGDWENSVAETTMTRLMQSLKEGAYDYTFDRCLELGNDTVLIQKSQLKNAAGDLKKVSKAADKSGYYLADQTDNFLLYHINQNGNFGTITSYAAVAIGTEAGKMSLYDPAIKETTSNKLEDYTYKQLVQFPVIYLLGADYSSAKATELLTKLQEAGVHLVYGTTLEQDQAEFTPALPKRELFPITVIHQPHSLEIQSEANGVNTSIAYLNIFLDSKDIYQQNHLLYVNSGTTTIHFKYPYLKRCIWLVLSGWILLKIFYTMFIEENKQEE